MKDHTWNKQELDIKINQFNSRVNELRKILGESDIEFNVSGIYDKYCNVYSSSQRFIGINIKVGKYGHRLFKRLMIENFDNQLNEKALWLAEKLDYYVGHNKRMIEFRKQRLNQEETRAKSINTKLESYNDSSGIYGKIKDYHVNISGSEIRISNIPDSLMKKICEVLEQ